MSVHEVVGLQTLFGGNGLQVEHVAGGWPSKGEVRARGRRRVKAMNRYISADAKSWNGLAG